MSNLSVKLKKGVPVVCLNSEPSSPSCHLRIFKNRDNNNQITLALHIAATLQGAEEEQAFIVQYDGDNLQSAAIDLEPSNIRSCVRDEIARHADPDFKTLTLCLKQPAPIWCPRDQAIAPQANVESVDIFNHVVNLAKATAVKLVVDLKWLAPDEQSVIRHIVKGKGIFAGFSSIPKYYTRYWVRRDWTYFAPAATPGLSGKRARPSFSSSGSASPPTKRVLLDDLNAPSPTVVASSPPYIAKADAETDFQTEAITRVVVRELPTILSTLLPAILTAVLPQQLPQLIPHFFVDPPSNSFDSNESTLPQLQLTTMGAALIPPLLQHLKPQLQDIESRVLSRTKAQRERAELEFDENVEDKKSELVEIVEQGKQDLETERGYQLDGLRHDIEEEADDLVEVVTDQVREAAEFVAEDAVKRLKEAARQLDLPHGCRCRTEVWLRGTRRGKGG
ncbi:hypothetical protein G6514_002535 [Epicoccum nigrum]|nr:hypothetical protein G6514_002535 [Epicoccum nigrum]